LEVTGFSLCFEGSLSFQLRRKPHRFPVIAIGELLRLRADLGEEDSERGFERLSRVEKGRRAPAASLDRQPAQGIAPSVEPPMVRIGFQS